MGVTSHNPEDIVLPPTMTSMPTGTWMLSGTSVIIDGKEAKRDYSSVNLETLKVNKTFMIQISSGAWAHFLNSGWFTIKPIIHVNMERKVTPPVLPQLGHFLFYCPFKEGY